MDKINKILLNIIILWSILAIIFGFYDLQISKYVVVYKNSQLFDIGNGYGDNFTRPLLYVCITILLGSIFNDIKTQRKIGTIMMIYFIIYYFYLFLCEKIINQYLILIFLIIFFISIYNKNWRNYLPIIVLIILLLIFTTIIIDIIKVSWRRIRYKDLTSDSEFTEWYIINRAKKHGSSFPSGHTANSCIFYPFLIYIKKKEISKKVKIILIFIVIGFSLYVGISRIVVGKHYASDVLFSIGICSILTIIFYKVFNSLDFFKEWGL